MSNGDVRDIPDKRYTSYLVWVLDYLSRKSGGILTEMIYRYGGSAKSSKRRLVLRGIQLTGHVPCREAFSPSSIWELPLHK